MADNLGAIVQDGKVQSSTASQISLSSTKDKSGTNLDKDAFLQLLVAQMKYQDPLEPTDNTEYIAQLANFSELEEMQNLNAGMSLQRASGMVGQEVVIKVINAQTGGTEYKQGLVDYVVYENNKAYVSIDEALYSVDDVYQVIDSKYSAAYELGKRFVSALASLPSLDELTTGYSEAVSTLRETYNGMSSYERSFVAADAVELLAQYEAKLKTLKTKEENAAAAAAAASTTTQTTTETTEETEATQETEAVSESTEVSEGTGTTE